MERAKEILERSRFFRAVHRHRFGEGDYPHILDSAELLRREGESLNESIRKAAVMYWDLHERRQLDRQTSGRDQESGSGHGSNEKSDEVAQEEDGKTG